MAIPGGARQGDRGEVPATPAIFDTPNPKKTYLRDRSRTTFINAISIEIDFTSSDKVQLLSSCCSSFVSIIVELFVALKFCCCLLFIITSARTKP